MTFITLVKFGESQNSVICRGTGWAFSNFEKAVLPNDDITLSYTGKHYFCICNDETSCYDCSKYINGYFKYAETLDSCPDEKYEIRIFIDFEISSTLFAESRTVFYDKTLTIADVSHVYENVQDRLIVDNINLSTQVNSYLTIKPKSSILEITLGTDTKTYYYEFKIENNDYLALHVTNIDEEGVTVPRISKKGDGELNSFNYPFDQIYDYTSNNRIVKGAYVICNSQSGMCPQDTINGYKIMDSFEDFNQEIEYEDHCKIAVVLGSYSNNIEANVNKFKNHKFFFYDGTSLTKLLENEPKLKFISTEILKNKDDEFSQLDGSDGGVSLKSADSDSFIVSFDNILTIKQSGYIEKEVQITIEPRKANAKILIDETVSFENQKIKVQSSNANQKLSVYVGEKEINDEVNNFFEKPENIKFEVKPGLPPEGDDNDGDEGDENQGVSSDNNNKDDGNDDVFEIVSSDNNNGGEDETNGEGNGDVNEGVSSNKKEGDSDNGNGGNDDDVNENASTIKNDDGNVGDGDVDKTTSDAVNEPIVDSKTNTGDGPGQNGGESSSGNKLSGGQIAGIVVGVIAFVAIVAVVVFIVIRKKKMSKSDKEDSNLSDENTTDL